MNPVGRLFCRPKRGQAIGHPDNSNVYKILPVTPLRSIDLGGKKNSDPLFSRFYAEMTVFFEANLAPKYVHPKRIARAYR